MYGNQPVGQRVNSYFLEFRHCKRILHLSDTFKSKFRRKAVEAQGV